MARKNEQNMLNADGSVRDQCTHCGEWLDPATTIWLGLNKKTRKYTSKPIPEEHDQGGFPFGPTCGKTCDGKSAGSVGKRRR